jgi:hypothetical protein
MKRWLIFLLVMVMVGGLPYAEKLGTLTRVLRPEMIEISDNELYVVEEASIFVYSLEDLRFIRKFGQKGEGPGELKVNPAVTNFLVPLADSVFIVGFDKAIRFSKTGQVIKEFRFPTFTNYLCPLGKNYVGIRFKPGDKGKADLAVVIFDQDFKVIKELYVQPLSGGQNLIDLTIDSLNISIYNEKIFIEQSPKGFLISVFDTGGNQLYQVKKEYEKIKFTEKHEETALNRLKQDRQIKALGWENFKKLVKIIHGDFLPTIQDMTVADNHIYVKTPHKKNDDAEFIIMDLKGNTLKKVYLPEVKKTKVLDEVLGRPARFYKIYRNKFYYLHENEEVEEWELYVEPIK